jgi:hypothetical protein
MPQTPKNPTAIAIIVAALTTREIRSALRLIGFMNAGQGGLRGFRSMSPVLNEP